MKIWLDDLRDPNNVVIQQKFGATPDMVWIKDPYECITLIESGVVTEISFDHDLGFGPLTFHPELTTNPDGHCDGYDVAKVLCRMVHQGLIKKPIWRVHSSNIPAKQFMVKMLTRYLGEN